MNRCVYGAMALMIAALTGAASAADAPKRETPAAASARADAQRIKAEKQERADIAALEARKGAPQSVIQERKLLLAPDDVNERLKAAEAYLQEAGDSPSKLDSAAEHVNAVLASSPNDVRALMLAGRIGMLRNQPAQAQVHYRSALAVDPNNASAYLALGDTWTRLGNDQQASLAFNEYRKLKGMKPLAAAGSEPEPVLPAGQQAPIIVGPRKKK
jgi:Tfp pilus assembly protein PilF